MDGLTQAYTFEEGMPMCEPIDLSHFVMDLREGLRILGTLYSCASKRARQQTLHLSSMARPPYVYYTYLVGAWLCTSHTSCSLGRFMSLDLPRDIIPIMARFRLCAHTLRVLNSDLEPQHLPYLPGITWHAGDKVPFSLLLKVLRVFFVGIEIGASTNSFTFVLHAALHSHSFY